MKVKVPSEEDLRLNSCRLCGKPVSKDGYFCKKCWKIWIDDRVKTSHELEYPDTHKEVREKEIKEILGNFYDDSVENCMRCNEERLYNPVVSFIPKFEQAVKDLLNLVDASKKQK
jgi:hypothetical protein